MPNRMMRDVGLTSRKLAAASDWGERLYWRLYQAADDFGRFHGDPAIIRARCCPLMLAAKSESDILDGRNQLAALGLLVLYRVAGEDYVQITKFGQRVRAKESKFPGPNDGEVLARDCTPRASAAVVVVVDEDVVEGGGGDGALALPPPHVFHEPEEPRRCPDCTALLALLRDVPVYFPEQGEVGYSQVHAAHSVAGQARAVAAVRAQIERHRAGKIPKKFLAPAMLFDPKHWQVTINSVDDEAKPRIVYPRV